MPLNRRLGKHSFSSEGVIFLAVLAVASALVLVGRLSTQELAGFATTATALYAAWWRRPPEDGSGSGSHSNGR
jgi:hypothetical protein